MSSCKIDPNNLEAKTDCKCGIKKFFKKLFGCKKDSCCKNQAKEDSSQKDKESSRHCGHNH